MKSIRNSFEIVKEFSSLTKAHGKARLAKRNQRNVISFEMSLSYNLFKLKHELENKTYKMGDYHTFFVTEPKRREIMAIEYRDRVVMHSLCDNVLGPFIDSKLDYDNAACRKGRGTHFALQRTSQFMRTAFHKWGRDYYVLKCDIKQYFYSIRHDVLKKNLYKYIEDKNIIWLLDIIIDSTEGNVGLPIGNMTSQWFAIFYLDIMDRFIRNTLKIKLYSRYMDDFLLIHNDKEYLKSCLKQLTEFIDKELGLTFNKKTQILPIKNGVDYVGFHMYLTKTGKVIKRLRHRSVAGMKRKVRAFNTKYASGEMSLEDIKNCVVSWTGHASHGHTYRVRTKILSKLVLKRKPNK